MRPRRGRRLAGLLLAVLLAVPAGAMVQAEATEGFYGRHSQGSDARILYLGARAAADGEDPTDPAAIRARVLDSGVLLPHEVDGFDPHSPGGGADSVWQTKYLLAVPAVAAALARPSPAALREVLAGSLGLACTWLAMTGRLHLPVYDLLAVPAVAWLLGGAATVGADLDRRDPGPRLRWLFAPLGLVPLLVDRAEVYTESAVEPTLALMVLWLGVALRITSAGVQGRWLRPATHTGGRSRS